MPASLRSMAVASRLLPTLLLLNGLAAPVAAQDRAAATRVDIPTTASGIMNVVRAMPMGHAPITVSLERTTEGTADLVVALFGYVKAKDSTVAPMPFDLKTTVDQRATTVAMRPNTRVITERAGNLLLATDTYRVPVSDSVLETWARATSLAFSVSRLSVTADHRDALARFAALTTAARTTTASPATSPSRRAAQTSIPVMAATDAKRLAAWAGPWADLSTADNGTREIVRFGDDGANTRVLGGTYRLTTRADAVLVADSLFFLGSTRADEPARVVWRGMVTRRSDKTFDVRFQEDTASACVANAEPAWSAMRTATWTRITQKDLDRMVPREIARRETMPQTRC